MPKQEVETGKTLTNIQEKIESLQKCGTEVNRHAHSSIIVLHPQLPGPALLPAIQLLSLLGPTVLFKINYS